MSRSVTSEKLVLYALWGLGLCFLLHLVYALTLTPVFGDDAFNHLAWLEDFTLLRAFGQEYPRWLPYTFGGMGSPTFYFYPPLCYLIADTYYSLGLVTTPTGLFHAVNASTLVLSAITFYIYLSSRQFTVTHRLAGSLLYSIAGYRYVDVYTRAALGEHAAFAWLPLILLSVDLAYRATTSADRLRSLCLAAFAWALLILTNIPSSAIAAMLVVPYGLLLFRREIIRIWPAALGAMLAVLMCSISLIPIMTFKPIIQTVNLWNLDIFSSQWHHFLVEIFEPETRKSAIQISAILAVLLSIPTGFFLLRVTDRNSRRWIIALVSIAALSLFFQLPFISDVFWDRLTPLQLLQFSWRFTVGFVIFTAIAIPIILQFDQRRGAYLLSAAAVISLFFYLRFGYIMLTYPAPPYMVEAVKRGAPEYINQYVTKSKDSVRTWAISLMGKPIFTSDELIMFENESTLADTVSATITARTTYDLKVKRLWWPQWRAEYRLHETSPYREATIVPDSNGLVIVKALPAGKLDVRLMITKSDAERTGETLSLFGVGIFSALCIAGIALSRKKL